LTAAFRDTNNVEVIIDRRSTRTSDRGEPVEQERRVLDRDADLAALGWILIPRPSAD